MQPPPPPRPLAFALALAGAGGLAAARRRAVAGLLAAAGLLAPGAARAESLPVSVLQNDGFTGAAAFPAGFAAGDTLAVRLDAVPAAGAVIGVELVLGGAAAAGPYPVTVKIWDDSARTLEPGPELFHLDTQVEATGALQAIFLAGVGVSGPIRVGVVLGAAAPPVIGQDTDGTLDADRNLVLRAGAGAAWHRSQDDGATGDWIIRAELAGGAGGGGGGGDACPASPCPAGQRCDLATQRCTAGCSADADCGGGTCDDLGQCVAGGGGGGGCQSGARPVTALATACAGLAALALVLRRRRRR